MEAELPPPAQASQTWPPSAPSAQTEVKPAFHVAPSAGWVNDPNGPLLYNGVYHMFYQHLPQSAVWGFKLVWGHAVSRDLVTWEELPHAIEPTPGTVDADGCFSGCAAIDHDGTPVLLYTGVRLRGSTQDGPLPPPECDLGLPFVESQCLVRAEDPEGDWRLTRWCKSHVPIIALPPPNTGLAGWRDPYVVGPPEGDPEQGWTMLIGSGLKGQGGTVLQYKSYNLSHGWQLVGELCSGTQEDGTGIVWECPLLVKLPFLHLQPQLQQQHQLQPQPPPQQQQQQQSQEEHRTDHQLESGESWGSNSSSQVAAAAAQQDGKFFFCISPDACTNPTLYYLGDCVEGCEGHVPASTTRADGPALPSPPGICPTKFLVRDAAGPFRLDLGDILYAPNTLIDPKNGRVLLWGWLQEARKVVGEYSYAGCLSCPRELWLEDDPDPDHVTLPAAGRSDGHVVTPDGNDTTTTTQGPAAVTPSNGVDSSTQGCCPATTPAVTNATPGSAPGGSTAGAPDGAPPPSSRCTTRLVQRPAPELAALRLQHSAWLWPPSGAKEGTTPSLPPGVKAKHTPGSVGGVVTSPAGKATPPPAAAAAAEDGISRSGSNRIDIDDDDEGSYVASTSAQPLRDMQAEQNETVAAVLGSPDPRLPGRQWQDISSPVQQQQQQQRWQQQLHKGEAAASPSLDADGDLPLREAVSPTQLKQGSHHPGGYGDTRLDAADQQLHGGLFVGAGSSVPIPKVTGPYLDLELDLVLVPDLAHEPEQDTQDWHTTSTHPAAGSPLPAANGGSSSIRAADSPAAADRAVGDIGSWGADFCTPGPASPQPTTGPASPQPTTGATSPLRSPGAASPAPMSPVGLAQGMGRAGGRQEAARVLPPEGACSGVLVRSWQVGAEGAAAVLFSWATGMLEVVFESIDPETHQFSLAAPGCRRVGGKLARPPAPGQPLQLRVLLDFSLLEVFTGGGEVLSTRIYRGTPPPGAGAGVEVVSVGCTTRVSRAAAYEMRSCWVTHPHPPLPGVGAAAGPPVLPPLGGEELEAYLAGLGQPQQLPLAGDELEAYLAGLGLADVSAAGTADGGGDGQVVDGDGYVGADLGPEAAAGNAAVMGRQQAGLGGGGVGEEDGGDGGGGGRGGASVTLYGSRGPRGSPDMALLGVLPLEVEPWTPGGDAPHHTGWLPGSPAPRHTTWSMGSSLPRHTLTPRDVGERSDMLRAYPGSEGQRGLAAGWHMRHRGDVQQQQQQQQLGGDSWSDGYGGGGSAGSGLVPAGSGEGEWGYEWVGQPEVALAMS